MKVHSKEVDEEMLKHPEMIDFCGKNLFKIACPDECPYYETCKSFRYKNKWGDMIMVYPFDYY